MKRIIFILLLLPFYSGAQKIKVNEFDKFIKQRRVETFPLQVISVTNIRLAISFSAIGSKFFVQLSGTGLGANRIDANDNVIFLLDNDSTVTVKSTGYQNFEIGATVSSYRHNYTVSLTDLEKLSQNSLQALRKYHADEFDDIYIPKKSSEQIKQLTDMFLQELQKENILQAVRTAEANEVLKKAEDSAALATKETVKPEEKVAAPAFPGGYEVWMQFLNRNLKPPAEQAVGENKTVVVQFLVSADGEVSNIEITQSGGAAYDKEVLRVLKRMPKWKSAIEKGQPVNAIVTQPVTFYRTGTPKTF